MRFAIIGSGGMGNFHASLIKEIEGFKIESFVDINEERAKELAKKYGAPKYYKRWQDAIKDENIDAVIICTPVRFHKEIAIGALEAGKHVLCEKPPAMNSEEALEMADVAKSTGRILMYGFQWRFYNIAQYTKKLIKEGYLGDIYRIRIHYLRQRGIPQGTGGWFRLKKFAGGGPLIDCAIHFIDLAYWLTNRPKPILAFGKAYNVLTKNLPNFDVEDTFVGIVVFENDISMIIEAAWVQNWYNEHAVMIYGSKAGVRIYPNLEIVRRTNDEFEVTKLKIEHWKMAHIKKLKHFEEVTKKGYQEITPSPEDGVMIMKIIDALYKSAKMGRMVEID